jgi:hypothetical protein
MLETTTNPEHIGQDLNDNQLFSEVDDLDDPEGDPPDERRFW